MNHPPSFSDFDFGDFDLPPLPDDFGGNFGDDFGFDPGFDAPDFSDPSWEDVIIYGDPGADFEDDAAFWDEFDFGDDMGGPDFPPLPAPDDVIGDDTAFIAWAVDMGIDTTGWDTLTWAELGDDGLLTDDMLDGIIYGFDDFGFPPPAHGGDIADFMRGALTADMLYGDGGDDYVYGYQGDDYCYGNQGLDTIYGGQGDDWGFGGQGDDNIYGNAGADNIYGNLDVDYLFGGRDDDVLYGGQGDDLLWGGSGDDALYGNAGDDALDAGPGNDTLTGGGGHDLFIVGFGPIGDNGDAKVITDFTIGEDMLGVADPFTDWTVADADSGEGAIISFDNGGQVLLLGVAAADVTDDLFLM